jgi:hypothetical protein
VTLADALHDAQWARVLDLLRTWPGAGRRLSSDELDAYREVFERPYGAERGAIADPLELEAVLRAMLLDDMDGRRPSIGAVHARLVAERRSRLAASPSAPKRWGADAQPAEDWALAHAIAERLPTADVMRAVARRHGRPTNPPHDATCELCLLLELEVNWINDQVAAHGPAYRARFDYPLDRASFEAELGRRFPWLGKESGSAASTL